MKTGLTGRLCRLAFVLACASVLSSCGISKAFLSNSPRYHAGVANPTGYAPEGTLEECVYRCSVEGPESRRMLVYLPKGYHDTDTRYPVLYLLHGARGYETSWVKKGTLLQLTDSLFREGLAEPCIVVTPNMNQYKDDSDFDDSRYKDMFESVFEVDGAVESSFVEDVVGYVDSHFRTLARKESRAIAGLSIGGLQSMYISANNPASFDYVGLFSPMCGIIRKAGPHSSFYRDRREKQSEQFSEGNSPLLYNIYVGKGDVVYPQVRMYTRYMDRMGFPYDVYYTRGDHDWPNWKAYYIDLLQRLWKKEPVELAPIVIRK